MYYSILRPLLLTILASLPASLVFNLLLFGIYSTQCLYRNHFLINFLFKFLLLFFFDVISYCLRTAAIGAASCRSQFLADQFITLIYYVSSCRYSSLNGMSLHSSRALGEILAVIVSLLVCESSRNQFSNDSRRFSHSPRARELRQARESS